MKNIIRTISLIFIASNLNAQSVGIDASNVAGAKFTVEQTNGTTFKPEQTIWNRTTDFTRLRFRNNSLGYWDLSARIGSLSNPSLDTFKITTDLEPNFFVMRGNGQIGINTPNPLFRLHIEGTNRPGVFARTTNASTDSGAIMGILDVPTGASFRASAVRGESKSTTTSSIGVYGLQRGGGWGVAGSAVEAGADDWGAGVFGEMIGGTGGSGVYGTNSNSGGYGGRFRDFSGLGFALYTQGRLRLTGINEAAGKVLTSDATGNANWQTLPGGAGAWTVNGNNIFNSNTGFVGINTINPAYALHVTAKNKYGIFSTATVNGTDTIAGIYGLALSPTPVPFSAGVRGESNSTNINGIGVLGIHSGSGWGVAGFVKELGGAGYGAGVYGSAGSSLSGSGVGGYGVYGVNNNSGGAAGYFENNASSSNSYALKARSISNTAALFEGNSGSGIAVEIDGAIKVNSSATNRPTFTHVTAVSNIIANYSTITYPNPLSSDFVMVIPNFTAGPVYNNHPIGVFFTAGKWAIFNQDLVAMPVGTAFNVMVIRQ